MIRLLAYLVLSLGLLSALPALAGPPEGVTIERKIKAKKVEKTFHGQWRIQVPPEMARSIQVLKAALTEGPGADLSALDLTPDEQVLVQGVMAGLARAGDEADEIRKNQLKELEAAAEGMEVHVTEDKMDLVVGSERTTASWEALRVRHNHLELKSALDDEPARLIEVTFIDRDRALLASDGEQTVEIKRIEE
ncbi:MAG: hypothetical protein EA397_02145 [Deltaproteobacteria bacterium]|nr:MAG: hypothetical protein EA397_02145 [Deltaproteobacteria bacterium]